MQYAGFFSEIFDSPIIAMRSGLQKYLPYLQAHQEGKILDFPERAALRMSLFDIGNGFAPQGTIKPEDSVAVIPVNGLMTREGSWWDYGANDYADMLKQAYADASIKAIVLRMNTVGGTVDSSFPLKATLSVRNKPVLSAIDSKAYSMGYYFAALTDGIYGVDQMVGLGSIGVMSRMELWDEVYKKQYGLKIIEIYPPESTWKNKPEREAMAGKPQLLIDETLSPWAQHFQEIVRSNRPQLDESVEGVIEGRTFFARDCTPGKNGLIDGIMPFDEIIKYAADYERNNKINKFFNH
ncbi:MAG TPA: S49 family peptidase [Prolixibacteraceae bacterium]|nr:S49 family peptidase [Prolixibacteraceae bacterium]